jgi:hypothetical protein
MTWSALNGCQLKLPALLGAWRFAPASGVWSWLTAAALEPPALARIHMGHARGKRRERSQKVAR